MDLSYETIALLTLVAFLAGAIDAVAGGGGLLTIPALLAAGVSPVAAIATNKLQSTFGTGGAVIAFARSGRIDLRAFAAPALASFAGAAAGALVLTWIDPAILEGIIPLLLIAMALYFLFGPRMGEEDRRARAGRAALCIAAAGIGFYDGFFGPGTGSFFTTLLVAVFGLGMVRAIAHAKLLNLASNVAALAVMITGGHVLWVAGLCMAAGSVLGGQVGAHTTIRYGGRIIRPLLVIVSLALTARLVSDPANPLTAAMLAWLGSP